MFVNKISFSILNVKEIVKTIKKAVCIPSTRMEAVFEGKVTYLTRETMIKPCNERLMSWRSNFVEHNRNDPLLALMSPPKMKKILYRQRSRTPQSESFSCEEEHLHQRKRWSPSRKGALHHCYVSMFFNCWTWIELDGYENLAGSRRKKNKNKSEDLILSRL